MDSNKTPIIIDIEASGFGKGSYPIEVGFVMPDGKTHCFLIRPESDWISWDNSAEQLHGISREILRTHGRPAKEVAETLNNLLKNKRVYTDAWGQDLSWLSLLFDAAGVPLCFQLEHLRCLISDKLSEHWHPMKKKIEQELGVNRHRASNDALILQTTYMRLLEHHKD